MKKISHNHLNLGKAIVQKALWLIVLSIFVAACATSTKKENKVQTLESLEDKSVNIIIDKDVAVDNAKDKALEIYKSIDEGASDPNIKMEAKKRLADLELERGEDQYLQQIDQARQSTEVLEPESVKEESYSKAIAMYQDLLKKSKKGTDNSEIMYQLAKAYEAVGQQEKALHFLDQIVKQYPNIPNMGEIQFRRGEINFLLQSFKNAEEAYASVLGMGEFSLFYEKALYKYGWSLFKLGRYEEALDSLFALLDRKLIDTVDASLRAQQAGLSSDRINSSSISRGDQSLIDDTFRVVNLSLSYLDGAKSIKKYFDKHGHHDYEDLIYERLGDFYIKQERIRDAAEAYLTFTKNNAHHPRAPFFELKVIEAYKKGGFSDLLFSAKKEFVERYAVSGNNWRKLGGSVQIQLQPFLKSNIEDVARHYHAIAQKSKNSEDYKHAISWYQIYLKSFPKDLNVPMINFLLADCYFETKRYKDAVEQYEKTAYRFHTFEKSAEAGYAALVAYSEYEKQLQGKEKTAWQSLAIGSALRFGKVFPTDPRAPTVLIKVAEDLFSMKKYEQADQAARQVLRTQTNLENRIAAWKIIAFSSFEKGDYKQAEISYKVGLSIVKENNPSQKEFVEGLAASVYKEGEKLREKGDLLGAVAQFARISNLAPDSSIVETAAYDIATIQIELKNWTAAIEALNNFRNTYPDSKLVSDATQNLIVAYNKIEQPSKAAEELERLINYKDDPELKRQATWEVASLFEKAGDTEKEVSAYKHYIDLYPNPLEQAMEGRQRLADIYKNKNNQKNYHYWLRAIVKADEAGKDQRTDRSRYLAANAAYVLAKPLYEAFQTIKLVEPLKVNLKKKKSKMERALKAYQNVAQYGIAEFTTSATFHIATIYNELATGLLKSERPHGLSAEELEQYNLLLEDQAYPFQEKAIEIFETNVHRISQGVFDEWVEKSLTALSKLFPVRYAKLERGEAFIDVVQ